MRRYEFRTPFGGNVDEIRQFLDKRRMKRAERGGTGGIVGWEATMETLCYWLDKAEREIDKLEAELHGSRA